MSSKRKFAALALGRRIRPRKEDNWEPEADLSEEHGSAGEEESGDDDDSDAQSNDHGRDDEAGDSDSASGSNSEVLSPSMNLMRFLQCLLLIGWGTQYGL